ncbi:MAG: bifunctional riboflavin kinase/FAD synthetase [Planctomycetota bacterium]|jgi:riboflavin kinase/FMN adenylyltransferase
MKRIHLNAIVDAPRISKASAVTLGVFDGMHQGHLSVLDYTCEVGRALNVDTVVVTFSIHPENLLNGGAPLMILTLEHRLRLMERAGIDIAVIIPFDENTRNMPAEQFLDEFLIQSLNIKAIILGHDSAFGKKREGDIRFLKERMERHGYEVHRTREVTVRNSVISSTRIREAITSGDFTLVEEMLGRELSIMGKVVPGDSRGRTIGYPTANLDCSYSILPPAGVYSVRVLHKHVKRRAVMNIGTRPTFYEKQARPTVEVHIPNWSGDLYDEILEVFIIRKIRDEKRFNSVEELIQAIENDIASMGE